MIIDITLLILFLASTIVLWYRASLKIPELVAIPDQVITERFQEDSAKRRLFVLQIKTYYREGKYKPVFWQFVGKNLYRLHLLLLRFDNWVVIYLKNARIRSVEEKLEEEELVPEIPESRQLVESYWEKIQKHYPIPASATETSRPARNRKKVDL